MAHTFLHGGEIPGINVNIKMSGHLAHFSFRNSTVAVKLKIANIFFLFLKNGQTSWDRNIGSCIGELCKRSRNSCKREVKLLQCQDNTTVGTNTLMQCVYSKVSQIL
jgi:hypothetical protein